MSAALGRPPSPSTEEIAVTVALTNRSGGVCTVLGYPRVVALDRAGRALPFHVTHEHPLEAFDITRAPPRRVPLAPGQSAYLLLAQFACNSAAPQQATSIVLDMPQARVRLRVPLASQPLLAYCGGGSGQPGNTLTITPFERPWRRLYRSYGRHSRSS